MKWDDVGAPEYSIYRGTSPSALTFLAVTAFATFTDTGVSGGQTYYYGVRSREPDGVESDLSNIIVATIPST
jgi:fibronectin type 3 domain-containing protein